MDGGDHVAQARLRAGERRTRQRAWLRPLGWAVVAIVIVSAADGKPAPGVHGRGLPILLAVIAWVAAMVVVMDERMVAGGRTERAVIAVMAAAGITLTALQTRGATELAGSVVVWVTVTRLPGRSGLIGAAIATAGLGAASALARNNSETVLAEVLLCALLGFMARFMVTARESQERTEVLLAELEAARDEQARAAALAERGRIAAELHDVLAHALSGAAIQLQGARMLAERDGSTLQLRAAIERSSELVRSGLADAREAVGALRGERLPDATQVNELVARHRADTSGEARFVSRGDPADLPAEAGLALYRTAQEALTNAARYAPGGAVEVTLDVDASRARLTVEDAGRVPGALEVTGLGGGHGLAGLRERVERLGGTLEAGPGQRGWRVEVEVPR